MSSKYPRYGVLEAGGYIGNNTISFEGRPGISRGGVASEFASIDDRRQSSGEELWIGDFDAYRAGEPSYNPEIEPMSDWMASAKCKFTDRNDAMCVKAVGAYESSLG